MTELKFENFQIKNPLQHAMLIPVILEDIKYDKTFNKMALLQLLAVILLGVILPVGIPIVIAVLQVNGVLSSYLWTYAYWISLVPCFFAGFMITDFLGEIKWYNYTPISYETI